MTPFKRFRISAACAVVLLTGTAAWAQSPQDQSPAARTQACERERRDQDTVLRETLARSRRLMDSVYAGSGWDAIKERTEVAARQFRGYGKSAWNQSIRRDGESDSALRERVAEAIRTNPAYLQQFLDEECLPRVNGILNRLFGEGGQYQPVSAGVTVQATRPPRTGETARATPPGQVLLTANFRIAGLEVRDGPEIRFTYNPVTDAVGYEINPSVEETTGILAGAREEQLRIETTYQTCIRTVGTGPNAGDSKGTPGARAQ